MLDKFLCIHFYQFQLARLLSALLFYSNILTKIYVTFIITLVTIYH